MACSLLTSSGMNAHRVIAVSKESGTVGPETNANQAGASSNKAVAHAESSPARFAPHRDEPDECFTTDHLASDSEHARAIVNPSAANPGAPGEASANVAVVVAQRRMEEPWPLTLDEIIKRTLVRLLRETAGNRRRTASLLGISRSTLYRMLARYGIDHVGRGATSLKPRVDSSVLPS